MHTGAINIRWMIRADMPQVFEIQESHYQWDGLSEKEFIALMRKRQSIGMIAEVNEQVVGYFIYELHKAKIKLLYLVVDPKFQRRGVGTTIIKKLISKLSSERRTRLTVEIEDDNLGAHLFMKAMGFDVICNRDTYKFIYRERVRQ